MFWLLNDEQFSSEEAATRQRLGFCFRLLTASFFSYQAFDFLFSPVWMHGYIWSLNQKVDLELNIKSAGAIVEHQLSVCGYTERVIYSIILVFLVWILLSVFGFRDGKRSVWHLLRISLMIGALSGNLRCLQMKQRLYSAIHEGFYAYFFTFWIGLILTLQPTERMANASEETKPHERLSIIGQCPMTKKVS